MTVSHLLWVALGGALGAVSRAWVSHVLSSDFPWATLVVNVVGSFIIGIVMSLESSGHAFQATARSLVAVGFCGAFTTFSTFSFQTLSLMNQGKLLHALLNIGLSLFLTILAVWLGMRLVR